MASDTAIDNHKKYLVLWLWSNLSEMKDIYKKLSFMLQKVLKQTFYKLPGNTLFKIYTFCQKV